MPLDLVNSSDSHPVTDNASETARHPRYYHKLCPPFLNEPTRDKVQVVRTHDGKGEGLISLVDVAEGEVVFRFFGPVQSEQSLFTLQQAPGHYVSDPLVMGKVLHSCDPNMACDMSTLTFTARRDIKAGEFLTMDYETTEDELFRSFTCGCGAETCRGAIRGRAFRRP